ncbi:hypothetical protein [Erysipelothrix piscisicarius]|uniref:hypothetical protein n=1 Tax=Erysipelothrix piscisicarius TaxID=2485784 RepID=UPI002F9590B0
MDDSSKRYCTSSKRFAMQLSKLGGGVSINSSHLRAKGESIKDIPNVLRKVYIWGSKTFR